MKKSESVHEGYFQFEPEDPVYEDHFPGNPVVPGTLIIDAFVTAARSVMEGQGGCSIDNFRFRHFISPGRYAFCMAFQADGRVRCTLYDNGRKVVAGGITRLVQGAGQS